MLSKIAKTFFGKYGHLGEYELMNSRTEFRHLRGLCTENSQIFGITGKLMSENSKLRFPIKRIFAEKLNSETLVSNYSRLIMTSH